MSLTIKQQEDTWVLEVKELFEFETHEEFMKFIDFLTKLKISCGDENKSDRVSMLKSLQQNLNQDEDIWNKMGESIKIAPSRDYPWVNAPKKYQTKSKSALEQFREWLKND